MQTFHLIEACPTASVSNGRAAPWARPFGSEAAQSLWLAGAAGLFGVDVPGALDIPGRHSAGSIPFISSGVTARRSRPGPPARVTALGIAGYLGSRGTRTVDDFHRRLGRIVWDA